MQVTLDELDRLMGERARHSQDYRKVLAARSDEIGRLRSGIGPDSESWKSLERDSESARAQFEAMAGQLGRPVSRHDLPPLAFITLALVLAAVETPVNKFLFDVALQSSNVASYAVSFAMAAFVLMLAHIAGRQMRQYYSDFMTTTYWTNIALVALIMGILAVVLAVLTIGRAEFSAAALNNGLGDLFSNVGAKVATRGIVSVLADALGDTSAMILVTANVTSILVAFLLGYARHDPDKHFDEAYEEHKRTQRALVRRDEKYNREVGRVRERARSKLDDSNTKYTAVNAAIITQKSARNLVIDDDDRFCLPDLDPLSGMRADEPAPLPGANAVNSLVRASANVTRVAAREQK